MGVKEPYVVIIAELTQMRTFLSKKSSYRYAIASEVDSHFHTSSPMNANSKMKSNRVVVEMIFLEA